MAQEKIFYLNVDFYNLDSLMEFTEALYKNDFVLDYLSHTLDIDSDIPYCIKKSVDKSIVGYIYPDQSQASNVDDNNTMVLSIDADLEKVLENY